MIMALPKAPSENQEQHPSGFILWLAALLGIDVDDRYLSNSDLDEKVDITLTEVVPRLKVAQQQLDAAQEEIDAILDVMNYE